MDKKTNLYKIYIEKVENPSETKNELRSTEELLFESHDDLFRIFESAKSKNIFNDEEQAVQFSLGLKLFSEVMLKNRENPIFEQLKPTFGVFMEKIKSA